MKKLTLGIICLIGFLHYSLAQSASIKGTVIDTSEKKNISNAWYQFYANQIPFSLNLPVLIRTESSVLRSCSQGQFFMLVTHPNYADYFDHADLDGKSEITKKTVPMITKAQLLEEVIVKQQLGAIRMKKDTTEFIADSFKLAPNATVEDLLRRLPGFQVDKDGKITAQGEQYRKYWLMVKNFSEMIQLLQSRI